MGKPAARMGDTAKTCNDPTDLPVGTVIAAGTVLINGMPAAKQGDKIVGVDIHIIMIPSPGGPVPTPLPHPYNGMINDGLSSTVKIMGMPAAIVGSKSTNLPPHIPQGGPFQSPPSNQGEIIMGSPNVLIGNGGGGGGGGTGGGGESDADTAQAETQAMHTLDVKVVDKGNKPITGIGYSVKTPDDKKSEGVVVGEVKKTVAQEGDCEIELKAVTSAKWSAAEARVGDKVKLQAETAGCGSDAAAAFTVYLKDLNRADVAVTTFEGVKLQGDKAEVEWEYEYPESEQSVVDEKKSDKPLKYSKPVYYFIVKVENVEARSPMLAFKDFIEIELKDKEGKPVKDEAYEVFLSNGEVRRGKLDANGCARVEDVPPGDFSVKYPDAGEVGSES